MDIELLTQPSHSDLACLSEGIQAYNRETVPGFPEVSEERRFVVLARDVSGTVTGGLRASAYWGFLTIELLWLSEATRGHGIGSALMARAEAYAITHGFHHAKVETTSFQARPFYERLGYQVYGVLDDFPPGHRTYYLKKALVDA